MAAQDGSLEHLIARARGHEPIRVAVVDAAQRLVIETLRKAQELGLVEPRLVGVPEITKSVCRDIGWTPRDEWIVPASTDLGAAARAVELVRKGEAEAVMKGNIHTDELMHALLDADHGLRVPGQRVSHVFMVDIPTYPKLLAITDAAINIAPDLDAKADILTNAIALLRLLGTPTPKAAVLSAIETVNPSIASTLDAACLALMAKRGQIAGAIVDGPMAFDNAISADAAREKGIVSEVAGDVDILLVPDLVSGNILAKNLEYLAGATAAGIVMGLSVPVALSSRADPPAARLAALALAVMVHRAAPPRQRTESAREPVSAIYCAPQPDNACCPMGA